MSGDAQPNSNQRATAAADAVGDPPLLREKAAVGALCVVCGDRACSHLYYGVAACHGCKCFFWRTVKSRLNYVCRYGGTCSISTTGRNACRFCRFNRCLKAGMKMEAVKMDRKTPKTKKREIDSDEFDEQENIATPDVKRRKIDNRLLVSSLLLIDKTASDGNAKRANLHNVEPSLGNLIEEPELLDGYRTEMSYCATRIADEKSCYENERRMVTWAIDWCRQAADMEDIVRTDKTALLRSCCASLTLLELGVQSMGCATTQVPLCNDTYLHTMCQPPANSFINWKTLEHLTKWVHKELKPLCLKPKEAVLLKALIVLNPEAVGLSDEAVLAVRELRKRVNAALFQQCLQTMEAAEAASRLAAILLLIPQLTLMSVDVIEQVRVRSTFSKNGHEGLLFWLLYGDIFDDYSSLGEDSYLDHSASEASLVGRHANVIGGDRRRIRSRRSQVWRHCKLHHAGPDRLAELAARFLLLDAFISTFYLSPSFCIGITIFDATNSRWTDLENGWRYTVSEVKGMLDHVMEADGRIIRIFFEGQELWRPDRTLASYGVDPRDTVTVWLDTPTTAMVDENPFGKEVSENGDKKDCEGESEEVSSSTSEHQSAILVRPHGVIFRVLTYLRRRPPTPTVAAISTTSSAMTHTDGEDVPAATTANLLAVGDNYEIAFSQNNPSLTWKDRTQDCTDLKEVFSKFDSSAPICNEILYRARFLCAKYLGGAWRKVRVEQFRIRAITGGMSNLLFLVELPKGLRPVALEPEKALLRVQCQSDIDQLLAESVVFTLLSERSLGPKLLGVFPGGRFEQFIPSRPLQCLEISQKRFASKIAPMLARVHTLDVPITKEPSIMDTARSWLKRFRQTRASLSPIELYLTKAKLEESEYPKTLTVDDLEKELDFVESFLEASGSPVVFSHNDLQEGNILLMDGYEVKEDGKVVAGDGYENIEEPLTLIDFEYCSYNYRGFDLGNHFCEYGYDYSVEESPNYTIHQEYFKVEKERELFCEAYLEEVYQLRDSGENPHFPSDLVTGDRSKDLYRLKQETVLFMPVSNIFWSCWALINAEESSIEFDYKAYARDRIAFYFSQKKGIVAVFRRS
ncbi:unnamed protein product [Caenorhabditis auriculariae]|uniref:Uncharacterized protein n=1 Tax=Caenorhabditis auriculariae TaxID=2777116 RepID=A0A8S1HBG0_9PELO|nr:unnamed protein product [Caenorhabditis auriculariae]